MSGKQIKCETCGAWTDGTQPTCLQCGAAHHQKYTADRERRLNMPEWQFPWIAIHPDDHWLWKGVKYILRGGQAVFFFIMSILAWIGSSAAH
jgi:hypothetical protein